MVKYDFNITQGNNIYLDALVYVNNQTSGLLTYTMLTMFFLTAYWTFNRYTNDNELSLTYSLFSSTIIAIILYYTGLYMNTTLINGTILISMIFTQIILTSLLFYSRNKLGGD